MTDDRPSPAPSPAPAPPSEGICDAPWTGADLDLPPSYVLLGCGRTVGHDGLHEFEVMAIAWG